MNLAVNGLLINYKKVSTVNKDTGEVGEMFRVHVAYKNDNDVDLIGNTILMSYCSKNAVNVLRNNVGKPVKLVIGDKQIYGKENVYKKVIERINDVNVRDFN